MDERRAVEIYVPHTSRGGSGYLIDDVLILTAYHIVAHPVESDASSPEIRYDIRFVGDFEEGEAAWRDAGASLRWYDPECDIALLEYASVKPKFMVANVPPISLFAELGGETVCACGIGFPKIQKIQERQNPEPVEGRLSRIAGLNEKQLRLQVTSLIPSSADEWAGISGTALFVDAYCVGVIVETNKGFREKALWATPISRVLSNQDFCELVFGKSEVDLSKVGIDKSISPFFLKQPKIFEEQMAGGRVLVRRSSNLVCERN
jgi:hypothetical protein